MNQRISEGFPELRKFEENQLMEEIDKRQQEEIYRNIEEKKEQIVSEIIGLALGLLEFYGTEPDETFKYFIEKIKSL